MLIKQSLVPVFIIKQQRLKFTSNVKKHTFTENAVCNRNNRLRMAASYIKCPSWLLPLVHTFSARFQHLMG